MAERRIAVMVDGDNVGARHAPQILNAAAQVGRTDISRVYASLNHPSDWMQAPGYRLMHAGAGKNAADLLLSIDAMEFALLHGVEAFAIASSDGDFTHLAQRLRERGAHVLGLGEQKAPEAFRAACSGFVLLDATAAAPAPAGKAQGLTRFDDTIRDTIARHGADGRGLRVTELAARMHRAHGTRISTLPERNWRAYLAARPDLYDLDPKGPEAKVRFRCQG